MSSGFWIEQVDLERECERCDRYDEVEVVVDHESRLETWRCPECGHHNEDEFDDDDDDDWYDDDTGWPYDD